MSRNMNDNTETEKITNRRPSPTCCKYSRPLLPALVIDLQILCVLCVCVCVGGGGVSSYILGVISLWKMKIF